MAGSCAEPKTAFAAPCSADTGELAPVHCGLRLTLPELQRNAKALKGLYHKALGVKSAIPHPRILGVIRECGGKMHMHQRTWEEAATDFFEVCSLLRH